jgi:hypothetical protein
MVWLSGWARSVQLLADCFDAIVALLAVLRHCLSGGLVVCDVCRNESFVCCHTDVKAVVSASVYM